MQSFSSQRENKLKVVFDFRPLWHFLKVACSFLLSCPVCGLAEEAQSKSNRPNVLFIAIDDLNDWVGCLSGHPQATTPHIDQLAKQGTLFTNAHCQAPVCQPSRACLMTSTYPSSSGLYFLNPGIDASPVTQNKIKPRSEVRADARRTFDHARSFTTIRSPPPPWS